MLLEQILAANDKFCAQYIPQQLSPNPRRRLAVLTCMDCRLSGILEAAMGLDTGDAIFLKNAGNRVLNNEDVVRSLAAAVYELGVNEIIVVGHTKCGMKNIEGTAILQQMVKRGVVTGLKPAEIEEWLGKIQDEETNVKEAVQELQSSKWLPKDLAIHGLLLDISTFRLKKVVSGY